MASCGDSSAGTQCAQIYLLEKRPKHPEFATYESRLHTFESWPASLSQDKQELAAAGFFYIGKSDQTFCYYCGVGLKDWAPEDNPWEQHAVWFSTCCYLLTIQGQDYVNNIIGKPYSNQDDTRQSIHGNDSELNPQNIIEDHQDNETENIKSLRKETSNINLHCDEPSSSDVKICKICYSNKLEVLFLPCGHLVSCDMCAKRIEICVICRESVIRTMKVIM